MTLEDYENMPDTIELHDSIPAPHRWTLYQEGRYRLGFATISDEMRSVCASDPAIGAFKPNPRGYLQACAIWRLSPDQVVFVGDRADVDAAGAAAAGMPCVIIGRRKSDQGGHCQYDVLPTLERLSDVIHAS
jgi:FMN phosphatase YigB (HAD superfamily)